MISIITVCTGRELYLKRQIDSIREVGGYDLIDFEHLIVFQERPPSDKMQAYLNSQPFADKIKVGRTQSLEPVGAVLTTMAKKARYPIVFKLDDDCVILSKNFLFNAYKLCLKMPRAVIYPVLVFGETSLEINVSRRQCVYLETSNLYVTVGEPAFASGIYLIPLELFQQIPMQYQNDAEMVSIATLQGHYPRFQCLNGLILEHQEGRSGQFHRSKNAFGQEI